jgi:hypothetical protein
MHMLSITTMRTNQENRMKDCDSNSGSYFYPPVRMHQQQTMTFFLCYILGVRKKVVESKILLSIG